MFEFYLGAVIGAGVSGGLMWLVHARHRRLTRQFLVVKAEAARLHGTLPADLWFAIAPYEKD